MEDEEQLSEEQKKELREDVEQAQETVDIMKRSGAYATQLHNDVLDELFKSYRDRDGLRSSIAAYLSQAGACHYALAQERLCDRHDCAYCQMARAGVAPDGEALEGYVRQRVLAERQRCSLWLRMLIQEAGLSFDEERHQQWLASLPPAEEVLKERAVRQEKSADYERQCLNCSKVYGPGRSAVCPHDVIPPTVPRDCVHGLWNCKRCEWVGGYSSDVVHDKFLGRE